MHALRYLPTLPRSRHLCTVTCNHPAPPIHQSCSCTTQPPSAAHFCHTGHGDAQGDVARHDPRMASAQPYQSQHTHDGSCCYHEMCWCCSAQAPTASAPDTCAKHTCQAPQTDVAPKLQPFPIITTHPFPCKSIMELSPLSQHYLGHK